MKVAIHQPQYLPWLGYFDKMDQSDVFVLLDDVQYKKNEWQNRNKIRNAESWQWITVPVLHEFGRKINEIKIDDHSDWRDKHFKSIEMNYSHAPYFDAYFPFFKETFSRDWNLLVDINSYFIEYIKKTLGIETKIVKSSDLDIDSSSTQRLIDICRELGATSYIAGSGSSKYMDDSLFKENNIKIEIQKYIHPEYKQVYSPFEPYMSVIDLLFTNGDRSLDIIREGRNI